VVTSSRRHLFPMLPFELQHFCIAQRKSAALLYFSIGSDVGRRRQPVSLVRSPMIRSASDPFHSGTSRRTLLEGGVP
jgi:hypothetical protein